MLIVEVELVVFGCLSFAERLVLSCEWRMSHDKAQTRELDLETEQLPHTKVIQKVFRDLVKRVGLTNNHKERDKVGS